jgi:hypothetical protein
MAASLIIAHARHCATGCLTPHPPPQERRAEYAYGGRTE